MSSKRLLISTRYRKGELTAMTSFAIRESMLAEDQCEMVLPGEFSLARSPDVTAAMPITQELIDHLKTFVAKLEDAIKVAEVPAEEVKEVEPIKEEPKKDTNKPQKEAQTKKETACHTPH
jgi:CO dehydrogenase/acetyl-CoA synthase alpha subunit